MKFISEFGPIPEAAMGMGYWVKGNTVYDMTADRHVKFIEENPQLFDITPEEIEQAFVSSNEKKGTEGNAREQLVKRVAENGWLRVRHYEKPDYWSIQCDNIKRREHTIENFIYWCIENKLMTYSSPAIILGYDKPEDKLVYDWQEGGVKGFLIRESGKMSDFRTVEDRREMILSIYEMLIKQESILLEASLSRVLQHGKKGFMIISAFRPKNEASMENNFSNSVKLRSMLKEKGFGFFELIGHWDETFGQKQEAMPPAYQRMTKSIQKARDFHQKGGGNLDVSIELSYFVPFSERYGISYEQFIQVGLDLTTFFNQDAIIVYKPDTSTIEMIDRNNKTLMSWSGVSVTNIAQAYSRLRKELNHSFLYEGVRIFRTNNGCMYGNYLGYIMTENSYFIDLKIQQKLLNE